MEKCKCGGTPEFRHISQMPSRYYIICPVCRRQTEHHIKSFEAVKEWNKINETKQPKYHIDLYTALVLTNSFTNDEDLVYLRKKTDTSEYSPSIILSVREVKEKYDMRKTKVVNMRPYFCGEEYNGMLLTITE